MDTGVDDAVALVLAMLSPELEVVAVTTVAGNAPVRECTRNCLLLLELLHERAARSQRDGTSTYDNAREREAPSGIDVPPVAQGASAPLVKSLLTAPEVHGEDGLGGPLRSLPEPISVPTEEPAHELIARLGKELAGEVTLVTTGPLTNVATALQTDPAALASYERVVTMGGAFTVPGNTGPLAEFNMYVDPEAARAVFSAGLDLTLVPLDVTTRAVLARTAFAEGGRGDTMASPGRDLEAILRRALDYYARFQMGESGLDGGFMHDPLTVASSFRPDIIETSKVGVNIELGGDERGRTTLDPADDAPAIAVADRVDERGFHDLLMKRVIGPIFRAGGA